MTPRFYSRIPTLSTGRMDRDPAVENIYGDDSEPTDEELGWWDEDDIPVNIYGEETE